MLRECPTSDFMVPSGRYFAMETVDKMSDKEREIRNDAGRVDGEN
jgi:hypothetical protein